MPTLITKRFHFESGHWLPNVPEGHKCRRHHGHNYKLEVTISGSPLSSGFLIDFFDLDKIVNPIIAEVDHRMLNDIPGLENPTAELIGRWFLQRLRGAASFENPTCWISSIRVYETDECWADVTSGGESH